MRLSRRIVLLLIIAISLSLLNVNVLAAETEQAWDASCTAQHSIEAAPEESSSPEEDDKAVEENNPDDMESAPEPNVEEYAETDNPSEAAEEESSISKEMESVEDSSAQPKNRAEQEELQPQSTGGHTQEEAVDWANSQKGSTYAGNYGYQCVDLIREYYAYLGQAKPTGYAYDYLNDRNGHKPDGWEIHYGSDGIQPGDILVWTGGENGHVAIVVDTGSYSCTVMQQNADGLGHKWSNDAKGSFGTWSYSKISGYIHPDFIGAVETQLIEYLREGNVTKAREMNEKLPSTIIEDCVYSMSNEMKLAYKKEVQKWEKRYGEKIFNGYFLTDLDNDGVAELLIATKTCHADALIYGFRYNNGKLVKIGNVGGDDSCHSYPGHNGLLLVNYHWGYGTFCFVTLNGNTVTTEFIKGINFGTGDNYINVGNELDRHYTYRKGKYVINYDDLGGAPKSSNKTSPPKSRFTSISAGKKSFTVKWKKKTKVTGYQIQYCTKSNFKGAKTVTVKKASTVSHTVKNLKAGTKYYLRIRTFKKSGGEKYYSAWSLKKSVKTK